MSDSSDSLSPVDSSHTSLGDGEEVDGWGGLEDGQVLQQLKVLEASDHIRELQTIIRDRLVEREGGEGEKERVTETLCFSLQIYFKR